MANKISSFRGDYAFLSNFYDAPVTYEGMSFKNSEAAFQAAKCVDPSDRMQFQDMTPSSAKRLGRRVSLRPDWEHIKLGVMREIVLDKFTRNPDLKAKLLATGDAELIEGNTWRDTFWGVDAATGKGRNNLGRILMSVRTELAQLADGRRKRLGHLSQPDGLTEYVIPVVCTGTKYVRVRASDIKTAKAMAIEKQDRENRFSSDCMTDFKAEAMPPQLQLAPEDRAAWPYWGYGWYGSDGTDWRSYRTDGGPGSIPDMADESWPIPPFDANA